MEISEYKKLISKPKSKMRNIRCKYDGHSFMSKKECDYYKKLKLLEAYGKIKGLQCQVAIPIIVGGIPICNYVCDFLYYDERGKQVIDVKPTYNSEKSEKFYKKSLAYKLFDLKRKLVESIYLIKIHEV
jgi:hypothetical protein